MAITVGTNGWCTLAATERRLAQYATLITSSSTPIAEADVEAFITSRFHEINGYFRQRGITVAAITADAAATAQAALANELAAAADVLDAYNAGAKGRHPLAESYQAQYERIIGVIKTGAVDFGAVESDEEATPGIPSSHRTDGTHETKPLTSGRVF